MLFEHLAAQDAAEQEHKSGARAIIAANQRIHKSLDKFLRASGGDASEWNARLAMVEPAIKLIVQSASEDHDANPETVFAAVVAGLKKGCKECGCDCSDGTCDCKDCSTCHNAKVAHNGCTGEDCKFCANKGKFGQPDDSAAEEQEIAESKMAAADPDDVAKNCPNCKRESKWTVDASFITAADTETGDTFWSERVTLPKADQTGFGSEGSPKIDKGRVPKDGLKPVDVPSNAHPSEMQDIAEQANYDTQTDQGANAEPDSTRSPFERVNPDTPMQPEHHKAPRTKTWNGTEGLADPVTSHSKWAVLDGFSETD